MQLLNNSTLLDFEDINFEKKSIEQLLVPKKEESINNSIYDSILEKTINFRNDFLESPRTLFKNYIPKKLTFRMLLIPFSSLLVASFSFLYFYLFSNHYLLDSLFGILGLFSLPLTLISIIEIIRSSPDRKNILNLIDSYDSITSFLNLPKKIGRPYFNMKLLLNDELKLEESNATFEYLSSDELKHFLKLFSKDEFEFIKYNLQNSFNDNKVYSTILDDIVLLCYGKIEHIKNKRNSKMKEIQYKEFITNYTEEESKEQLNQYDFKSIL